MLNQYKFLFILLTLLFSLGIAIHMQGSSRAYFFKTLKTFAITKQQLKTDTNLPVEFNAIVDLNEEDDDQPSNEKIVAGTLIHMESVISLFGITRNPKIISIGTSAFPNTVNLDLIQVFRI